MDSGAQEAQSKAVAAEREVGWIFDLIRGMRVRDEIRVEYGRRLVLDLQEQSARKERAEAIGVRLRALSLEEAEIGARVSALQAEEQDLLEKLGRAAT